MIYASDLQSVKSLVSNWDWVFCIWEDWALQEK